MPTNNQVVSNGTLLIEGQTVGIGEWVGFKYDTEQSGKVESIKGNFVTVSNPNGIYYDNERSDSIDLHISDLWID